MKIGILTFANVPNFGANLQALSTVCYLKNNGHEPIIIKWEPIDFEARFMNIREQNQPKAHFDFCEKYLPWTDLCRTEKDIASVIEKEGIEAVIIGSDAVLQHHSLLSRIYFPTKTIFRVVNITSERIFPNAFWGTFSVYLKKETPLAIMSGSSQNTKYKYIFPATKHKMKISLSRFVYISVRDKWTYDMLRYLSAKTINPYITPDPVFAFNQNCSALIPSKEDILYRFNLPKNYILISMKTRLLHNKQWMSELKRCFLAYNLTCVALPMPTGIDFDHNFDYEITTPLSPIDWYALIKYSQGYVGENMHPIVVCLHNAIPCFSFDTYGILKYARIYCNEQSSKIYDIMADFSLLQNRCNAYSRFWKSPNPSEVVKQIISFDKEKCKTHSNLKVSQYNEMMKTIISIFQKNIK